MNDHVEALLDELEELVLDMHRSATDLDYIVMSIRDKQDLDEENFRWHVQALVELRANTKRDRFGDVDKAEGLIWNEILHGLD